MIPTGIDVHQLHSPICTKQQMLASLLHTGDPCSLLILCLLTRLDRFRVLFGVFYEINPGAVHAEMCDIAKCDANSPASPSVQEAGSPDWLNHFFWA